MQIVSENTRIVRTEQIVSAGELKAMLPVSNILRNQIVTQRAAIANVIFGRRQARLLVAPRPCSIHDIDAATEYFVWLAEMAKKYQEKMLIVAGVYCEKPRTGDDWDGLVYDPHMDGTFAMNDGLIMARKLMLDVATLGLPVMTEFLDNQLTHKFADLVSLGCIGARTALSPPHRKLATGLSMPVAFKHDQTGDVATAINAMIVAAQPRCFVGSDDVGQESLHFTTGNQDTCLVMRGSTKGANYDIQSLYEAQVLLDEAGMSSRIIVDCSHGNCSGDFTRQFEVGREVVAARRFTRVAGIMAECNLVAGKQKFAVGDDPTKLTYGQSITDACKGIEETSAWLGELYEML